MTQRRYEPIDPGSFTTPPTPRRRHTGGLVALAGRPRPAATVADLLDSMPDFLAVKNLRSAVEAIVSARRAQRPVVWAMGAHVVKVGCSPIVIDLIKRGVITAVAFNGSTAIHDVEVATQGATSEEVAETILDGTFGMVEETPAIFAEACKLATAERTGLGQALGKLVSGLSANYVEHSILAAAYQADIPLTVHVAIGTDTIHMHAGANGAQIGQASLIDFRLICSVVKDMAPGGSEPAAGVWCNIGSSVLLPEVFLKAVSVARNLGANLDEMHTLNMDMIRHYRPAQNVTGRPVQAGHGLEIIGHHEIMLPILRQAILEKMRP
ncbi:MAG: hypothetical protein O7D91_07440 [Planctomycetota bacterium]|nr:hypothetical protein [Planctomycetota bacterium]